MSLFALCWYLLTFGLNNKITFEKTKMLAIDFNALCHTLREMGQPSNSIAKIWQGIIQRDNHVVLLMDSKPYWRTLVYPEYKGNRTGSKPLERELVEQGTGLGLPLLCEPGLEADDWAGLMYLDKVINQRQERLKFLTVDTDWMQLVDDPLGVEWENLGKHAPVLRNHKEAVMWAFTRHRVWIPDPSYIGNLKRVLGDTIDNIPPNHPLPLTELRGPEWQNALTAAGYSIPQLLERISPLYAKADLVEVA